MSRTASKSSYHLFDERPKRRHRQSRSRKRGPLTESNIKRHNSGQIMHIALDDLFQFLNLRSSTRSELPVEPSDVGSMPTASQPQPHATLKELSHAKITHREFRV